MNAKNVDISDRSGTVFDLKKEDYWVWESGGGMYHAVVYSKYKALKLNRLLNYYPIDTRFLVGDEPQFIFGHEQLPAVLKTLGVQ